MFERPTTYAVPASPSTANDEVIEVTGVKVSTESEGQVTIAQTIKRRIMMRTILGVIGAVLLASAGVALGVAFWSQRSAHASGLETYTKNGAVIFGYDVVEYFSLGADDDGVLGSSTYIANLTSADTSTYEPQMTPTAFQFYFKNQENLDTFKSNPWKYAPQWGGFCAWGIAQELPPNWPWAVRYLLIL